MIQNIPQLHAKAWSNSCKKCVLKPNCLMNMIVFNIRMPNINKYIIVMDQLYNRLCNNGSSICSDGAFAVLIILLGLTGKQKHLGSLENFKCSGGKIRLGVEIQVYLLMFGKGG